MPKPDPAPDFLAPEVEAAVRRFAKVTNTTMADAVNFLLRYALGKEVADTPVDRRSLTHVLEPE